MAKIALVTGGNGITGSAITEYLVSHTTKDQWSKIIVTSRSAPRLPLNDPRLIFVALDFTRSAKDLAKEMRACCSDTTHAFFSSYLHRDEFADLVSANCSLLENFLTALTDVAPSFRNFTLQTGGKHYNLHLHPVSTPVREDDPVQEGSVENFYHWQQALLASRQKGSTWTYNVIRPQAIIGVAYGPNGMNSALCFAVYFTICSYMNLEAHMLTNERNWGGAEDVSSAQLIADLSLYAATTPRCANEAFNATNGDTFVWRYFWPRLAVHFDARASASHTFAKGSDITVVPGTFAQETSFTEWAKDKSQVWEEICDVRGCPEAKSTFDSATWAYQDWVFRRSWTATLSMNKAWKYGWKGWADSYDCFIETFLRFENMGIIPPRKLERNGLS